MTVSTTPRSTARLQLHKGFTLDDAAAVVPYLSALGISHVYTSPVQTSRPGSMHGYDIVDHAAVNPELGGEAALRRLVAALRDHEMGLVIDIVPNHMGVGGSDNAWWLDVLEWGTSSRYASFFDIDWDVSDPWIHGRVLQPFLGQAYGKCLDGGEITLKLDGELGRLSAVYGEHVFPIAPRHYAAVFSPHLDKFVAPVSTPSMARAMKEALRALAATPDGEAAIAECLERYNPADLEGRRRLHALLERQNYRLVWWRAAADEINWRRFFDITTLAGLRTELPTVFDETHALFERLYAEGLIDGVRVDHVDGLADPRSYCRKLRRRLESAGAQRPASAPAGEPYIVVEKILASHERLVADWHTNGTTGYDFMDEVARVLHDPAGEAPLSALWEELSGSDETYEDEERAARRLILRDALSSELNGTALALHRVARRDLATRDYTVTGIRRALTEILAHFPVYRLYAGVAGRDEVDDRVLAWAMAGAKRVMRAADHPLLDQIGEWLGGVSPRALPPGAERKTRMRATVRFEQLSSPVAAKSMEDTAFYRYGRLLSRNEVGSNPAQFALSPAGFHAIGVERRRRLPSAMLATATHDHKRGEDLRLRLAVLSEVPEAWADRLHRWMRLNAPLHRALDSGAAPDAVDEVMLYQMLVGAWPMTLAADDAEGVNAFAERIVQWQEKALREAKRHTAWVAPDAAYEAAAREFVFQVVDPARVSHQGAEIAAFAQRLAPAGALNSLSQTMLRLTVPGVPDLYQGTDLWDLSMVDPDNRRPVDYALRAAMLDKGLGVAECLSDWRSGAIKQALIVRLLALRAQYPGLFAEGSYRALRVTGANADHLVAFARQHGDVSLVVVVPRLTFALIGETDLPFVPVEAWRGTRIALPRGLAVRQWRDVLGSVRIAAGTTLPVASMLAQAPVGCFVCD